MLVTSSADTNTWSTSCNSCQEKNEMLDINNIYINNAK